MSQPKQDDKRKQEIEILNRAFQSFNEATQQLQSSYDKLQDRVKTLDLELARKNEELEVNLKEKEEVKNYLYYILESLTTGVIVVDGEGKITTFNKTAGTITDLEPPFCLGKTLKEVFELDLVENLVSRSGKTDAQNITLDREFKTFKGRNVNIRISSSPVMDNSGEPIGNVIIIQDTTQLKRLEEEAQRNQRLRATGEMAAGIAHEIRNPLGSIELFASLLKKDLEHDKEKTEVIDHISASIKNMDRIISSLLLFAKSPRPSQQKCDINEMLSNLLDNSANIIIPENIKTVRKFERDGMITNGDNGLLKQVFLNLIRNGVQAMPDGGELELTTEQSNSAFSINGARKDQRRFVTVTISDTGSGVPKEHLMKIFNPFFTTKDKGTGLGLSISHNIIKAHQGTIDAENRGGKGTTFIVKIPCWDHELDEH